ncbi:spermatogenesis associated 6-like protein isoform X2 [Cottoperca gobio]|uniref:Spermatogenesis associated 6-like protein isoform X2 n=1 Tax=Cottoperca gobio TaxID=56716 RepID=A0A6J2RL79_COTGO|nr:spermatogenesis-associated protein 6-like isoform X2 [Cottoperca gobio]
MSRKALKVVVELKFRAVSCPGVHLPAKDDIYLSMWFMGQYCQSECLPAVFPLLFHEKITFEKIFRHIVDPGDIAVMLEYETVTIELVQLIPPVTETLACFEEDARRFLFPEPKLVPCSSGVDREVLMTRAPHFRRPVIKRSRKHSSRPRSSSPQGKQPQTLGMRRGGRTCTERRSSAWSPSYIPRPHSLSPLRAGNTQRKHSTAPGPADWDTRHTSQPMLASWPGASRTATRSASSVFINSSSPLTRSSFRVRYSPTVRRKSLSNGLVGGMSEDDSSSSEMHDPIDKHQVPDPSRLWRSYREQARHSRSQSSSHREWEEVQERVRGLLTTPKAVRRLVYGATHCEIDEVLARRSFSPGPP